MGFESTDCNKTKEFCGAAWPSKVLKGKEGDPKCPLNAPMNFIVEPIHSLENLVPNQIQRFNALLKSMKFCCFEMIHKK
jgi:hypothetical protein